MLKRTLPEKKTSKYFGVHFSHGKWMAQIKVDKKNNYLGMFVDEKDAAIAYDMAKQDAMDKGLWKASKRMNFSTYKEATIEPHDLSKDGPDKNYEEIFKDNDSFDLETERLMLNEFGIGAPKRHWRNPTW